MLTDRMNQSFICYEPYYRVSPEVGIHQRVDDFTQMHTHTVSTEWV